MGTWSILWRRCSIIWKTRTLHERKGTDYPEEVCRAESRQICAVCQQTPAARYINSNRSMLRAACTCQGYKRKHRTSAVNQIMLIIIIDLYGLLIVDPAS